MIRSMVALAVACAFSIGLTAKAQMSPSEGPLKIVDATGKTVGRLFGNNKGTHVVFRWGQALTSLRVSQDQYGSLIPFSPGNYFWNGLGCSGQMLLPTGGEEGPGFGIPSVADARVIKATDGRFIAYLPSTASPSLNTIYSQGVPGACQRTQPVPLISFVAEPVPLDSYFVAPFKID